MARIRTVKPEFWQDSTIGELSSNARLLFLCSLNMADDEGLLSWNPAFLRAQAFIFDDLTMDDVAGYMRELTEPGIIFDYKDKKNNHYGWIVNFRKHQKIDRPQKAKNPLPSLQNPKVKEAYTLRDGALCHICGEEIVSELDQPHNTVLSIDHLKPKSLGGGDEPSNIKVAHQGCNAGKRNFVDDSPTARGTITAGKERKGREGKGSDKPPKKFTKPAIDEIKAYCQERNRGVNPDKWFNHYSANGWKVGKNPMKDWKAAIRTWEEAPGDEPEKQWHETSAGVILKASETDVIPVEGEPIGILKQRVADKLGITL